MKVIMTSVKLCLATIAFLLLVSIETQAITIRVPADYPKIQQAIHAAQDGDTVLVAPGTYVENINFLGKAITVTSEAGALATIIDGSNLKAVVAFVSGEPRTSILNGFTIRNGTTSSELGSFGGGITIQSSSPTITNNVITGNRVTPGGGAGVGIIGGAPLIQNNLITDNHLTSGSGGFGGGILAHAPSANLEILDNRILNNTHSSGGGIGLTYVVNPVTVRGNIIKNNYADNGGGMYILTIAPTSLLIVQNLIVENRAFIGGGLQWDALSGDLLNNTIAENEVTNTQNVGSAIYASYSDSSSNWVNNLIIAKSGKTAIACNTGGGSTLRNNNVYSTTGFPYGTSCADQTGVNGNFSAAPLFINPAAGDYHLMSNSPSIDAGTNTVPNLPTTDLDGNPRIFDGDHNGSFIIDMGVYEFGSTAFDICIQDDFSSDVLRINSTTGAYQLTRCKTGFTLIGTATLTRKGCTHTFQDFSSDRRILAKIDACQNNATATVQVFAQGLLFSLSDRNTTNNACACPNAH